MHSRRAGCKALARPCSLGFPPTEETQPRLLAPGRRGVTLSLIVKAFLLPATSLRRGVIGLALAAACWLDAGDTPVELPWAFHALEEQALPAVANDVWPHNRIDTFLLAEMEKAGLAPAAPAEDRVLLRRLHFDLTGLPPTAEEVENFDRSRLAETVEKLLASPHYGERWGRHWLDLARYTDVAESWLDTKSPPFLYRDWVVAAFNDDLPYDQFVIHQLANDLLPDSRPQDNAALGFIGLSPSYWKELKLPPEIISVTVAEEWEERVDTVGRTFLGLTLGCARCHDHKSDPVTAEDYYAIAGVFASVRIADRPVVSDELWKPVVEARARVESLEEKRKALRKKKPAPDDLKDQLAAMEREIQRIQTTTPHFDLASANGIVEAALFVKHKEDGDHGTQLDYQAGMARNLPLHRRGNPNDAGEIVPRRFLSVFPQANGRPRPLTQGSGRLELARALVEEAAPLSARVIVNRVWQHHFGRGLVETPSEFGPAGEAPTHPALLDDLAARFVANGWSLKWLHREILGSAAWQQASLVPPDKEARDPSNRFYSRMTRRRLDVESWRDAMLTASGEIDLRIGGEPFPLEDTSMTRRTLYGSIRRRDLDAMLSVNDFPDPNTHNASRTETTTPLQLLFSLNGPFVMERSAALGEELARTGKSDSERIHLAYARLFQRTPGPREESLALAYLAEEKSWERYAQVLLTSNEFLYLD